MAELATYTLPKNHWDYAPKKHENIIITKDFFEGLMKDRDQLNALRAAIRSLSVDGHQ